MGNVKRKGVNKKWNDDLLTEDQRAHLTLGFSWFDPNPFEDEPHRKRLWFKHRDSLIQMNFEGNGFFGARPDSDRGGYFTRPHGWWCYESPEPRKLLKGKFPPELLEHGYSFGLPRAWSHGDVYGCEWETQEEYLQRLNLLTEEEKKALEED